VTGVTSPLLAELNSILEGIEASTTPPSKAAKTASDQSVKDLLNDLVRLSTVAPLKSAMPVRTIHHLSCTGGTMIAKCVASMANVLVLNEIDFQSPIPSRDGTANFAPTDAVSLLRQAGDDVSPDDIADLFATTIETLRDHEWRRGRDLVLRDHTHSHFLWGDDIRDGPTLKETLEARLPVLSLVTIRDPIDTYASIVKNGWHTHFQPSTFDEFCRRHLLFLERYKGVPIVKYEAFVSRPKQVMQKICRVLHLDYFESFIDVFDSFQFSGDSGRSGAIIERRPRSEAAEDLRDEAIASKHYSELLSKTDYVAM